MKRIRTAGIIPYENGYIFMHRIKPTGEFKEYYTFVGGGKEENETTEEGCIREIKEEIGINVEIEKELYYLEGETMDEYFYLCKYISGELGTGDGPEFTNNPEYADSGIYTPVYIEKSEVENLLILPPQIRDRFIQDVKKEYIV